MFTDKGVIIVLAGDMPCVFKLKFYNEYRIIMQNCAHTNFVHFTTAVSESATNLLTTSKTSLNELFAKSYVLFEYVVPKSKGESLSLSEQSLVLYPVLQTHEPFRFVIDLK